MQNELSRLERLQEVLTQDGQAMVIALVILIIGLFAARLIDKGLRASLRRLLPTSPWVTTVCNIVYVAMVAIIVTAAAMEFGAQPVNMLRLMTIIALVASGLMIFLRPFIPSLPFKVGQTIKAGDLLGKVEKAIDVFPRSELIIEGHTDSFGGDDFNQKLSQERAESVQQYMINAMRIPTYRLIATGYGETRPVASNETEAGRARNRRIDIVIKPNIDAG